ncbi:MAG: hypothetical protein WCL11_26400, partial [Verrucomicrobiota bacterium]
MITRSFTSQAIPTSEPSMSASTASTPTSWTARLKRAATRLVTLAALVFVSLPLAAQMNSGDAFLKGNFIEVGIAAQGYFGTTYAPPTATPAYNTRSRTGLGFHANYTKSGTWTRFTSQTGDYFLPGSPEQGFTLGINGTNYSNNRSGSAYQITATSLGVSQSDTLQQATWVGSVGGLQLTRTVSFGPNDLSFKVAFSIKNTTGAAINNVYYMDNTDPDQGADMGLGYGTYNQVINQQDSGGSWVLSWVPNRTDLMLKIGSTDSNARVYTGGFSNRSAKAYWDANQPVAASYTSADQAAAVTYSFGNIAATDTVTGTYYFVLSSSVTIGSITVTAPAAANQQANSTTSGASRLQFTITNPNAATAITLSSVTAACSLAGWSASADTSALSGMVVPAGATVTVPVAVTIPTGTTATSNVTLTAVAVGTAVNVSDFCRVTATAPAGLNIVASTGSIGAACSTIRSASAVVGQTSSRQPTWVDVVPTMETVPPGIR